MIINDAHMFGLSELHQLRGRVGRYKHRAYCYLLLPRSRTISETAMKRLAAVENFSMLGAGFKIALRDLEIRGAGNLLGNEQKAHAVDTAVDLGITGALPRGYIPSDVRRMDAYRRISRANDYASLDKIRHDLTSAYGELPQRTEAMFQLAEIRISATLLGLRSITRHENDIIFKTGRPGDLEAHMRGAKGSLRMVGDVDAAGLTTVYYRPPKQYLDAPSLLTVLRRRLRREESVAPAPAASAAR